MATIEPTHEALLRQWGLLDGWLKEDFGLLAALEAVKRAAGEWDANARDPAWPAHRGERLADAGALDARPDIAASSMRPTAPISPPAATRRRPRGRRRRSSGASRRNSRERRARSSPSGRGPPSAWLGSRRSASSSPPYWPSSPSALAFTLSTKRNWRIKSRSLRSNKRTSRNKRSERRFVINRRPWRRHRRFR